ncbi:cytochrome c-type biogenesis protein CcmH [Marinicauda salina]|jgi:cytochrome c-type biogenesis protein CcmH|uniref:Cytochrome c-type biogenesis protein n=1 Tax=Marinicauda salina TaxID=2135793 RepID=A0A2U2BSP2_9PROT|nr:cytochrome c-type biogenesis protein [Marinicauda salina]PWE17034.1 cytochrome c-type biogenesis protein CcmH [Marinicauda salina]
MKALAIALALVVQAGPELPPEEEARAQDLMREVRCMVCAGESILDSNATMASDMRRFVRERVGEGMDDAEVRGALVARFGHEVLMRPPVDARTAPLWLAPLILLGLGGALLIAAMRKRS